MMEFNPKNIVPAGNQALVIGEERLMVKSTGKELKNAWVQIFTVKDGRVVSFESFNDVAACAEAFNL